MIIGIDASRANRKHKSGTEWYSFYLIKWLSEIDFENEYILYSDKPLLKCLTDLTADAHRDECGEEEIGSKGFQKIKSRHNNFKGKILNWPFNFLWTQGRLSLEMIFHKPDILFIPAHALPIIHPKNSIVTIHDVGFKRNESLYGHDYIGPEDKKGKFFLNFLISLLTFRNFCSNSYDYLAWSTDFSLKKARKIITVSGFTKEEVLKIYGDKTNINELDDKIKVVYNGFNDSLYKKIEDKEKVKEVLAKYNIEPPYILYVGRLEKKKNTPLLIEAFSVLKERGGNLKHKLVLVGDASFGYDEVKYSISEYMLDDEVIMPGWVEEADMPYIYAGAMAFVFPSFYEGFGLPVIQAMACGIPVAASNASSLPEIAGNAALLFDPHSASSIADAIGEIIADNKLRESLVEKGYKRAKDFSWAKCAKKTLKELMS